MALTQIKSAGLSKPLDFADGEKLRLGTGNDLQIEHTGGANSIQAAASQYLYIYADELRLNSKTGAEKYISMSVNGSVELYHNNVKKFQTHPDGSEVIGHLLMGDDKRIKLGASSDLQLYHGSNNSVISNSTGYLVISTGATESIYLQGQRVMGQPSGGGDVYFVGNKDGNFEAYYDNSKKFETTSGGTKITGNAEFRKDSTTTDFTNLSAPGANDSGLYVQNVGGQTGNFAALTAIAHSGNSVGMSASFIAKSHGTGYSPEVYITQRNGGNSQRTAIKISNPGAVELNHAGTKKLETASNGIQLLDELGINDNKAAMFGNDDDMKIYHTGSNAIINNQTGDLSIQSDGNLKLERKDGGEDYIHCIADGAVELHHNGVVRAQTHAQGFQSDKFIHRTGTSNGTGMNEQESIWIGGGLNFFHDNVTLSTNQYTHGFANSRGYAMFRIRNNGGQAIYAESGSISSGSDYRMKENIEELTNGIEAVKKLKPSIYNIRKSFNPDDDGTKHHGFIAHEVQEAIPNISNIVSGTKDGVQTSEGNEGKPDYQGIDYGHLTPILAAAIKELITKVETLETKVS